MRSALLAESRTSVLLALICAVLTCAARARGGAAELCGTDHAPSGNTTVCLEHTEAYPLDPLAIQVRSGRFGSWAGAWAWRAI